MKMTRLEWRYLQKVALDHPYFDTHKLPLTEKEAKAIVEANITMTGREFVDSIYAKLGMTRPQEEKKRSAWLRNLGELFTVPPIRKIAIAVLIVVLLVTFFAATPTGRAIAESVIQYVAILLEDGLLKIERNDQDTTWSRLDMEDPLIKIEMQDNNGKRVNINSFDEFENATGIKPAVLSLPYKKLFYDYNEPIGLLSLYAKYETAQGEIVAIQNWGADSALVSSTSGLQVYNKGSSVYYSYESEGRVAICKVFEDSIIVINATGGYSLKELVNMLEGE